MATPAVSDDRQSLEGFLHKWRERWPEWRVAEVFVAGGEREVAVAWFALLQELADAAWGGSDPRPGEAKLGWWVEELHGWSQQRRRHPLGQLLQPRHAPWTRLAASLPALLDSREPSGDAAQASALLAPVAEAMAAIEPVLFGSSGPGQPVDTDALSGSRIGIHALLARQLLLQGDAAAPLQVRARLGTAGEGGVASAWASQLLAGWPVVAAGARPVRILDALLQARLRRIAAGGGRSRPGSPLMVLLQAWRAARG